MSKDDWVAQVKTELEGPAEISIEDYRDGLQEILDDVYERYEAANDDVAEAESHS